MKIRFLQTFFLITAILILAAYSGGPAASGIDRTGSPLSGGQTCSQCHSGGGGTTVVVARMLDGTTPITNYTPGNVYTLELQVTNSSFTRFGVQAAVLNSTSGNAGLMNATPSTSNTRVSTLSTRKYLEHNGFSTTGIFRTQWTAPAAGMGTATIYAVGIAVNGTGATNGDRVSTAVQVQLTEAVATTISYSQSNYCQNGTDPTPTITGTSGGTFSSTAGLSINPSTGMIDVSASTPNTYTVTYTYGTGSTTTFGVTINTVDAATIGYAQSNYCASASNPSATITGTTGGTFSSTGGLNINASTGLVNLAASTPGTYTVTYTTNGACPTSTTTTLTVDAADVASISYGQSVYCGFDPNPSAVVTGTTGGSFAATPMGMNIDANTGLIDLASSAPQTYTVTYTTNGTCPTTTNTTVTVSVCAGLNELATTNFEVYPNPTSNGVVTIKNSNRAAQTQLEIYSSTGQLIISEQFYFDANAIKSATLPTYLPKGLYLVKLDQEGQIKTLGLLYQ